MVRYLLYFNYIGTKFKGVQRQMKPGNVDTSTVQGVIEKALGDYLKSEVTPRTYLSSRTDSGTHAFINTAHVDLEMSGGPTPNYLVFKLNKLLRESNVDDVRINQIIPVPKTFHARFNVVRRIYLYRLAVLNPEVEKDPYLARHYESCLPVSELFRIHTVRSNFDVLTFHRVLELYKGKHDFATFMGSPMSCSPVDTVRVLDSWLRPGKPMVPTDVNPLYQNLTDFHEVYFASRGFLYRQVRRLVGAAIRVAEGKMTFEQIIYMLNNPSTDSWDQRVKLAPACGLYLANLFYNSEDLKKSSKISVEEIDESSDTDE
ncbi:hypothetical protein CHUAL_000298 [Chamberlinius hualienensis]